MKNRIASEFLSIPDYTIFSNKYFTSYVFECFISFNDWNLHFIRIYISILCELLRIIFYLKKLSNQIQEFRI